MKKIAIALIAASLFFVSCGDESKTTKTFDFTFDTEMAIVDEGNVPFNSKSATQTVKDMRIGWNLGNTLDATNGSGPFSETSWGQPETEEIMIQGLADSKIKTIRIPVSWTKHIGDDQYTIDPLWMLRVKEIVDWAIDKDMYVILNTHHDNYPHPDAIKGHGYYYPNATNYEESVRFLTNIWGQIALAFNNGYDEHLIFETLNEPRLCGTDVEWNFSKTDSRTLEAADILNKYNQLIVDVIRASGGNNKERFIMLPGYAASPAAAFADEFKMPQDEQPDHLILSVHMYSPYIFAMQSPGITYWNDKLQSEIARTFKELNTKFIENGYPVIIGEFGATDKDNLEDRVGWAHSFIKYSRKYGMTSCLWDNGSTLPRGSKDYNEKYGYYDRLNQEWYFPEIIDAIIEEAYAD